MWMTSDTPGQYGNIFTKLENPDYSTITNTIQPLDKKRDEIVSDVTKEYNTQTQTMTVNKQVLGSAMYTANGTLRRDVIASKKRITLNWSGLTQAQAANIEAAFDAYDGASALLTVNASESWTVIGVSMDYTLEDVDSASVIRYAVAVVVEQV
jgi:hypothetical protein